MPDLNKDKTPKAMTQEELLASIPPEIASEFDSDTLTSNLGSSTPKTTTFKEVSDDSLKADTFSMDDFLGTSGDAATNAAAQTTPSATENSESEKSSDTSVIPDSIDSETMASILKEAGLDPNNIDLSEFDTYKGLNFFEQQKKARAFLADEIDKARMEMPEKPRFEPGLFTDDNLDPDVAELSNEEILMGSILKELLKTPPEAGKPFGEEVLRAFQKILFPFDLIEADDEFAGMNKMTLDQYEEKELLEEEKKGNLFHVSKKRIQKIVDKLAEKDQQGDGVAEVLGVIKMWGERVDRHIDKEQAKLHLEKLSKKFEPIMFNQALAKTGKDPDFNPTPDLMEKYKEMKLALDSGGKLSKGGIRSLLKKSFVPHEFTPEQEKEIEKEAIKEELEALMDPAKAEALDRKELDILEGKKTTNKKKYKNPLEAPLSAFNYDDDVDLNIFDRGAKAKKEADEAEELASQDGVKPKKETVKKSPSELLEQMNPDIEAEQYEREEEQREQMLEKQRKRVEQDAAAQAAAEEEKEENAPTTKDQKRAAAARAKKMLRIDKAGYIISRVFPPF
jgi:hypothetical protein